MYSQEKKKDFSFKVALGDENNDEVGVILDLNIILFVSLITGFISLNYIKNNVDINIFKYIDNNSSVSLFSYNGEYLKILPSQISIKPYDSE